MPVGAEKRWSVEEVEALIKRTEDLIGIELTDLIGEYRRGVTSPTPPPRENVHRLVQLFVRIQDSAHAEEGSLADTLARVNTVELEGAISLFEEWLGTPAWGEFQTALRTAPEYPHAVSTLAVANALKVRHPSLEIIPSPTQGKSPDINLPISGTAGLKVEVKAPRSLWQPDKHPKESQAIKLIDDAWDKAKAQLASDDPKRVSLLVIAGLTMSPDLVNRLTVAADYWLRRKPRPTLFGIALFNLAQGVDVVAGRAEVSLRQESRLRRNPAYRAKVQMMGTWESPWALYLVP